MYVLFDETGQLKTGTVMSEQNGVMQVEVLGGRRTKVKAAQILLNFEVPSARDLLGQAEQLSTDIDINLLWECAPDQEVHFTSLAGDWFGEKPSVVQSTALFLAIHTQPIYFNRRGKGLFQRASADNLRAALTGLERKRLQQLKLDAIVDQLLQGRLPPDIAADIPGFLYKPDRNRFEVKALEAAAQRLQLTVPQVLLKCGGLASHYDYHFGQFLFNYFPDGVGFPEASFSCVVPNDLPVANVQAFSIDDTTTTEIDDAFSVVWLSESQIQIGIHIAAPALGIAVDDAIDMIARSRLSTVYMPGDKITMLPESVIRAFSLEAGGVHPAVSLYVTVDLLSNDIIATESRIERVPIVANLRLPHLEDGFTEEAFTKGVLPDHPQRQEIATLYQFVQTLIAARELASGKGQRGGNRLDYNFYVDRQEGLAQIRIVPRRRGAPLDLLVAELMILANSHWAGMLGQEAVPGLFRGQQNNKVRMSLVPLPHGGMGVAQYAWCSSPLRRYVDLVNQWQLISILQAQAPVFPDGDGRLAEILRDFESMYVAYDIFQTHMERYWCLRWLEQESMQQITATVMREGSALVDGLPLMLKPIGLTDQASGTRIHLSIEDIDFWACQTTVRMVGLVEVSQDVI